MNVDETEHNGWSRLDMAFAMGLVVLNILVFGQTLGFDLVNFDDPVYLDHPLVTRGVTWEGIVWAFTDHSQNMSQTLPWISFMIEYDLFGRNPAAFHGTNLFLHALNTLLLFRLMVKMTRRPVESALVAALFSLHPLHVESVAWVSGRKDLIGVLFSLLMLMAYERFAATGKRVWLFPSMMAFLMAILAKPVYVTLPFLLLVLDFWPLRRWGLPSGAYSPAPFGRLVIEKLPLFILTFFFCWVAYRGQAGIGILITDEVSPMSTRLANAPVLYVLYLFKTFWPFNLSPFYPLHVELRPLGQVAGSIILLLGLTGVFLKSWRQHPYLISGWLWFLGTLVPVIGIVRAGWFEMADRYSYLPLVGVFIALVWGGARFLSGRSLSFKPAFGMGALLLGCLVVLSFNQTRVWKNGAVLFTHAAGVFPDNSLIQTNLGNAYMLEGKPALAIGPLKKALSLQPENFGAHHNLADAYRGLGRTAQAIQEYRAMLRLDPNHLPAHFYLGDLYYKEKNIRRAIQHSLVAQAMLMQRYGNRVKQTGEVQARLRRYFEEYRLKPEEYPDVRNPAALLEPEKEEPDA